MNIRNSVKAISIEENKILLTKNKDDDGYFYLCPGGGQEHGETFHMTLGRECVEEIGKEVEVGELLFIREYIGKNHEHANFDLHVHQVEFYFACTVKRDVNMPTHPDSHQVGFEWIILEDLSEIRIYPNELKSYIYTQDTGVSSSIYLGDIN